MELDYNEARQQKDYKQQTALPYTGPPINNTLQQALTLPEPLAIENKRIFLLCTLCTTPTQFNDYGKLENHV